MEALGAFAVLISFGGLMIISNSCYCLLFMVHISGIAQKVRNSSYSENEVKYKLDRIIRLNGTGGKPKTHE